MSEWINDNMPIHHIFFDESGCIKNLEEMFEHACCRIQTGDPNCSESMIYVLLDKKDAVIIDNELCWGRMLLQYNRSGDHGSTFFMKTDFTHSEKIGRRNYTSW